MNLRKRILDCDPTMYVRDIVSYDNISRLPDHIGEQFMSMKVLWDNNRSWGKSFNLGDKGVLIGHRRGDHIASYPHLHGLSEEDATEYLRRSIEGTLLHELGHAVLDHLRKRRKGIMKEIGKVALDGEPPISTYRGHDPEQMSGEQLIHEIFAEAFRYWCHDDPQLRAQFPRWHQLVDDSVKQL